MKKLNSIINLKIITDNDESNEYIEKSNNPSVNERIDEYDKNEYIEEELFDEIKSEKSISGLFGRLLLNEKNKYKDLYNKNNNNKKIDFI